MTIPTEVSYRNVDRSEALTADINSKVEKLEEFFDRIISCRVVVEAPHRGHHQGNLFHVRIHLQVPNRELIVDRAAHDKHEHEDPYVAVRDAFAAIRRQLEDYVRELRGETKSRSPQPHGQISKILLPEGPDFPERGYGFIATRDGRQIYFHANSLVDVAFPELEVGNEVRYEESLGDKGPQATSVHRVGRHAHRIE